MDSVIRLAILGSTGSVIISGAADTPTILFFGSPIPSFMFMGCELFVSGQNILATPTTDSDGVAVHTISIDNDVALCGVQQVMQAAILTGTGPVLGADVTNAVRVTAGEAPRSPGVNLNEIYASHSGADDREFVEIVGETGLSLDGIAVLVVVLIPEVLYFLNRARKNFARVFVIREHVIHVVRVHAREKYRPFHREAVVDARDEFARSFRRRKRRRRRVDVLFLFRLERIFRPLLSRHRRQERRRPRDGRSSRSSSSPRPRHHRRRQLRGGGGHFRSIIIPTKSNRCRPDARASVTLASTRVRPRLRYRRRPGESDESGHTSSSLCIFGIFETKRDIFSVSKARKCFSL